MLLPASRLVGLVIPSASDCHPKTFKFGRTFKWLYSKEYPTATAQITVEKAPQQSRTLSYFIRAIYSVVMPVLG